MDHVLYYLKLVVIAFYEDQLNIPLSSEVFLKREVSNLKVENKKCLPCTQLIKFCGYEI